MMTFTTSYDDLRALAIESWDGAIDIPINTFNKYLIQIMKSLLTFKQDANVELAVDLQIPTDSNQLTYMTLPNDIELLKSVDKEDGTHLFKTNTATNVRENEELYIRANQTLYFNPSVTKVIIYYTADIITPEKLMYPTHDIALDAIIEGIAWKHTDFEYTYHKRGTQTMVNALRRRYLELKASLQKEMQTLELKAITKL